MKKTIKTVAVIGAGAVGAYVLYGLQDKYKENLWVVAEGERAERLKKQGLIINDVPYALHVKTPQEAHGVDLLMVCLKYGNLPDALQDIREVAGPNTTIMSIMNGVDTEDIIAQVVPKEQIIHSLIRIASHHQGNRITFPVPEGDMGIIYGLPEVETGMEPGRIPVGRLERLEAVGACMEGTKIVSHQTNEILKEIWKKYGLNISFNIPQAILSAGVGIYIDSEHAAFLRDALCKEVVMLAESYGIIITLPEIIAGVRPDAIPKFSRFSTLQDLDAKRPTEIDMFCGTAMRLGQEQGILVPYNTFAYHAIKALEEKNAGKFEY